MPRELKIRAAHGKTKKPNAETAENTRRTSSQPGFSARLRCLNDREKKRGLIQESWNDRFPSWERARLARNAGGAGIYRGFEHVSSADVCRRDA